MELKGDAVRLPTDLPQFFAEPEVREPRGLSCGQAALNRPGSDGGMISAGATWRMRPPNARWHNHQRLHSSLDDVPPIEFETAHYDATTGHDKPVAV